jgi:hypothetical protein
MAEPYELTVEAGRIIGTLTSSRTRETVRSVWDVPLKTADETERFVRELASDPLLAGRWTLGEPLEDDRRRAGADERGWQSSCDCGMRQPCRHSQTVLFQFRTETKTNPWLWLTAAGMDMETAKGAIREARARMAPRDQAAPLQAAIRAKRAVADRAAGTPVIPVALRRRGEPAFWNRDVSFADWLSPIVTAVREKEEESYEHDHDIDTDTDTAGKSNASLDSHVHSRT